MATEHFLSLALLKNRNFSMIFFIFSPNFFLFSHDTNSRKFHILLTRQILVSLLKKSNFFKTFYLKTEIFKKNFIVLKQTFSQKEKF